MTHKITKKELNDLCTIFHGNNGGKVKKVDPKQLSELRKGFDPKKRPTGVPKETKRRLN